MPSLPYVDGDCLIDCEVEGSSQTEEGEEELGTPEFVADLVNFQTPPYLCAYMTSLIPAKYKRSLVVEPTPGAGNLLVALREAGFKRVEAPPGDFYQWWPSRRPQVVIGNPPWSPMRQAYDIMKRCLLEFEPDFVVMLMPWLTLINSERRTELLVEFGLQRVIHVPRSTFPGIRAQCCILVLEKGYQGRVELDFFSQ